jgi:hypothetical protein
MNSANTFQKIFLNRNIFNYILSFLSGYMFCDWIDGDKALKLSCYKDIIDCNWNLVFTSEAYRIAFQKGDFGIVWFLHQHYPHVKPCTFSIIETIKRGHLGSLKWIYEKYGFIECDDDCHHSGWSTNPYKLKSMMHWASEYGHLEILRWLFDKYYVNFPDRPDVEDVRRNLHCIPCGGACNCEDIEYPDCREEKKMSILSATEKGHHLCFIFFFLRR